MKNLGSELIRNILLGIAIGDAFGAGIEFQDRNWIRANVDFTHLINVRNEIKVAPALKENFTRNYQAWDYTDDTEMTIGVLKALVSAEDFSEKLLLKKWQEEYDLGKETKGYGRNGHGSMRWFFSGEKTMEEIRAFQKNRNNPGNAPAMRSIPIGLVEEEKINRYAEINANATHPNMNAIISSQCIARAAEFLLMKNGSLHEVITYCMNQVELNQEYHSYLSAVEKLGTYDELEHRDFETLCGSQPIETPYFLAGIHGMPSDSKYTTGCVLYVLKNSSNAMDALKQSIYLGGDVDSVAALTTGIMAGKTGLDSLPDYMLENVEGVDYLTQIAKYCQLGLE